MFKLNFSKKLINSPTFPDEILHSFVPTSTYHVVPSHVSSLVMQSEEERESEPTSQRPKKAKRARASRKGKEKVHESPISNTDSQQEDEPPESKATPSPPPAAKKRKITSAAKNKKTKMATADISHYYSSSDEEQTLLPSVLAQKKTRGREVNSDDDGCDVEITKEVQNRAAGTLQQMAQAAKRRLGL